MLIFRSSASQVIEVLLWGVPFYGAMPSRQVVPKSRNFLKEFIPEFLITGLTDAYEPKEILESFLFCMYLGSFTLLPLQKAK